MAKAILAAARVTSTLCVVMAHTVRSRFSGWRNWISALWIRFTWPGASIEMDLSQATSYGASLVSVLLKAAKRVQVSGGEFRVSGDHTGVLKVLKLDGVLGRRREPCQDARFRY